MNDTALATAPWTAAHRVWRVGAEYALGMGDGWWTGSEVGLRRWASWWSESAGTPIEATTLPFHLAGYHRRFWSEVWRRRTPEWVSPNRVVLDRPFARLRDFSQGAQGGTPVLLLPPQAGHASTVVDYSRDQSQIQTLRRAGLPRVWAAEWLGATGATRDTGIDDYLRFMRECIAAIGEPVHLIGDCQGGWQATIYTALFPEDVRTLTLAGAPIDFQAGDGAIKHWVNAICGIAGMSFHRALVATNGGILPGRALLQGFTVINPKQDFEKYAALYENLDNPAFMQRHREFETWYQHAQDLPGRFYLWLVENLFWKNQLVEGGLRALGRPVNLSAISQPLALLAGAKDHITPAAQVFGILPHVSTPREQVVEITADGGHLGLFMGHSALSREWPMVAKHLLEHERVLTAA